MLVENHIDPCGCLKDVFELLFHNLDFHNSPKWTCNLSYGTEKHEKKFKLYEWYILCNKKWMCDFKLKMGEFWVLTRLKWVIIADLKYVFHKEDGNLIDKNTPELKDRYILGK